jgi:hypothetical protein
MSKVVALFEAPGLTADQYDSLMNDMKAEGKLPNPNHLAHVAFQKDDKWCVVDVWNSAEAMNEFAMTTLIPVFVKLGITPPPPPQVYPLHSLMDMSGKEE